MTDSAVGAPRGAGRANPESEAALAAVTTPEGSAELPFGGVKLSGSGRDKSRHALDAYTDLKTTWIRYG